MSLHYVYAHYDGDEIVYIGAGKGGRCWDTHGTRRNKAHREWMLSLLPFLKYEILFFSENRREVFKEENRLIKLHSPKFNLSKSRKFSDSELEIHREQMTKINSTKIKCTHCLKMFSAGMYSRWHGDNCKQKG